MKLRNLIFLAFFSTSLIVIVSVAVGVQKMYLTHSDGLIVIGITIVANCIGLAIGLFLLRGTFRSIRSLSQQTNEIKQNQFKKVELKHAPQELNSLAQDFNQMAAALDKSFEALAESEQEKSSLVAQLGHDIKTPLTALKNQIEAIQDQVITAEELPQATGQMIQQVDRLTMLTNQLMQVAIVENPSDPAQENHLTIVWLDQLLLSLLASFQYKLQKKQQKITVELDDSIQSIKTDEFKLNRILMNLIENASKYSKAQTEIRLKIATDDDNVIFSVIDQGEGIAESELPYIFDRMYRVEKSRSAQTGGSGLGLYISRSLAKQLHGQLEVESTLGVGSRFNLTIPK